MKIIDYLIKGLKNINLFPKVEIKIGSFYDDYVSLSNDWNVVGEDIKQAMNEYKKKKQIVYTAQYHYLFFFLCSFVFSLLIFS